MTTIKRTLRGPSGGSASKLKLDDVLSVMVPGHEYTSVELAQLVGASRSTVTELLRRVRSHSRVDVRVAARIGHYSLAGSMPRILPPPRVVPDLTATMVGYDAVLRSHWTLSMAARGAR